MAFVEAFKRQRHALRPPPGRPRLGLLRAAAIDNPESGMEALRITSVPEPETVPVHRRRLATKRGGQRFAFAVTDSASGRCWAAPATTTSLPAVKRVEIGWTWYAKACSAPLSTPPANSCC